jgi:hypothetical protein
MSTSARLDIAKKAAVNTTNHGQAVITATNREGRGMVHLSLWRKERGAAHGVSGVDLTLQQAMRLQAILTDAIRAAVPDAALDGALDGAPEADNAAREAAGEVLPHGGRNSSEAA